MQKRILDILFSSVSLLLLIPFYLLLALLVRVKLGKPVLYRQTRAGQHGKPFVLYKFRSMVDLYDAEGGLLSDEQRLTPFGQFLRSYSLDELPELWNVLIGQMSLVGPRPLLTSYLVRYNTEQMRRHEVKPGITGWAQIHGRNTLSWQEKFRQDVWYVNHRNTWLDIKIIGITLVKMFTREGVSAKDHATMPEFHGDSSLS